MTSKWSLRECIGFRVLGVPLRWAALLGRGLGFAALEQTGQESTVAAPAHTSAPEDRIFRGSVLRVGALS